MLSLWYLETHTVWDTFWFNSYFINHFFVFFIMAPCDFIYFYDLIIDLVVVFEVNSFEEIDFALCWRTGVSKREVFQLIFCIWLLLVSSCHLCSIFREFFCYFKQLLFNFQNGSIFNQYVVVEVLYEYLW